MNYANQAIRNVARLFPRSTVYGTTHSRVVGIGRTLSAYKVTRPRKRMSAHAAHALMVDYLDQAETIDLAVAHLIDGHDPCRVTA